MLTNFTWDSAKAESNFKKHGVRFDDAIYVFLGRVFVREDTRQDYREVRFVALGMVDNRVIAIVYTDRDNVRRIISARKANAREQRAYHQALAQRPPPDT